MAQHGGVAVASSVDRAAVGLSALALPGSIRTHAHATQLDTADVVNTSFSSMPVPAALASTPGQAASAFHCQTTASQVASLANYDRGTFDDAQSSCGVSLVQSHVGHGLPHTPGCVPTPPPSCSPPTLNAVYTCKRLCIDRANCAGQPQCS